MKNMAFRTQAIFSAVFPLLTMDFEWKAVESRAWDSHEHLKHSISFNIIHIMRSLGMDQRHGRRILTVRTTVTREALSVPVDPDAEAIGFRGGDAAARPRCIAATGPGRDSVTMPFGLRPVANTWATLDKGPSSHGRRSEPDKVPSCKALVECGDRVKQTDRQRKKRLSNMIFSQVGQRFRPKRKSPGQQRSRQLEYHSKQPYRSPYQIVFGSHLGERQLPRAASSPPWAGFFWSWRWSTALAKQARPAIALPSKKLLRSYCLNHEAL